MHAVDLPRLCAAEPDTMILDVRSRFEYRRGHVPGAIHLPFWAAAFRPLPAPSPTTQVVVYCGHGPRAWIAQALLRWRGAANVCLLQGHMAGWRRAGRPLQH
jgi:rhodanese-related sulfurtransferase